MTAKQRKEVEAAIGGWCGWNDGGRVTGWKPDGFSISMGDSSGFDVELWSWECVEAALKTFAPNPIVRTNMARLLRAVYWQHVGNLGSYEPILKQATDIMLSHILAQIEANEKIKGEVA